MTIAGRTYAPGDAEGPVVALSEPLSFWGGIDVTTGRIIDRSHPDLGTCVAGAVLVMPGARGSSSSSAVLAEAIRRGTAPVAIVLGAADPILTVGALVADSLYGIRCPVVVCPPGRLGAARRVRVRAAARGAALIEVL